MGFEKPATWQPKRSDIPQQPGVYRFLDARGAILYVGKAKNLRNRLSSYFAKNNRERTVHMLSLAASVEWTVVADDFEALRLEHSWIKEFDPLCNVQFKDDKTYPYLAVTLAEKAPRLLITRKRIAGAKYFGPYPKVWPLKETVALLQKVFQIRSCSSANYNRALRSAKPCFEGQIGRCFGPCSQRFSFAEHREHVQQLTEFLEGADAQLAQRLTADMQAASEAMDYERAAYCRDQLRAAEIILAKSAVLQSDQVSGDFIALAADDLVAAVQCFRVLKGRITAVNAWMIERQLDQNNAALLTRSIMEIYEQQDLPKQIFLAQNPEDAQSLLTWLNQRGKTRLVVRPRQQRAKLLETVQENAELELRKYQSQRCNDYAARHRALLEIQEALELPEAPLRIECFDISHLSGTDIVGSMVTFEDGLPQKKAYRIFNIAQAKDDTDAIAQVLERRLARLITDESSSRYYPSLFLIDGGRPQVNAARKALKEVSVPVCGLAKRMEELWLPDKPWPVIMPRNADGLFLLQRIRDEAHRFAIVNQQKRRRKGISTQLLEIPGVGSAKARILLRHFSSLKRIREASVEQISELPGFGPQLAQKIKDQLMI